MKPILKWPGGKAKVAGELKKFITPELLAGHKYIEPFIGGGALAFDLQHVPSIISDLNSELINLYEVVKHDPEKLILLLKDHQKEHSKEWYYEVRSWDRDHGYTDLTPVVRAARTVYLNKTCFNGLYRVNSKGYFNTPIGRTTTGKIPDIVQEDEIRKLSEFLKSVEIRCGDYRSVLHDEAASGDVVYLDPPYDPGEEIHTSGFVSYQKEGWTRHDLVAMKDECDYFSNLGCKIVISNNDTTFVRELFAGWNITPVDVHHSINIKGDNRKGKEVIITNF